jgi:hypothetical protein
MGSFTNLRLQLNTKHSFLTFLPATPFFAISKNKIIFHSTRSLPLSYSPVCEKDDVVFVLKDESP